MAESRGIHIMRQADGVVTFLATLLDALNAKISTGIAQVRLWHVVPGSNSLETFDFTNGSFTTGVPLSAVANMVPLFAENGTYATGVWIYRFPGLSELEVGDKYIWEVSHPNLPHPLNYTFQYGGVEGDALEPLTPGRKADVTTTGSIFGASRGILLSIGQQGTTVRIECAYQEEGVVKTAVTSCQAQIFDQNGAVQLTVSPAQFGLANARGFFGFTWSPHSLVPGQNYQLVVTIDGVTTTKPFKVLTV